MASTSSVGNASSANASSAQAFYTHFRASTDSLLSQLSNPTTGSDSLQQALAKYASLSAELTQAVDSGVLPSHDQGVHKRRLEEVSAALEQRRRSLEEGKQVDKGEGKKRGGFAFKRKQPVVASAPIPTPSATAASEEVTTATASSLDEPQPSRQSSHLTISTLQDTRYTHPIPTTTTSQLTPISLDLTNISHSIVDLRSIATTHTILAVQIRNVHTSAVLLPHIEGSVMVHDLSQSAFGVASCHQFRMHVSKDTVVQLETKRGSVVTIEGCSGVRFVTRRETEEIRVQDFDDLMNSEGLRSADGGQGKGNYSVVKSRGDEGLENRIDAMSGLEDDIKSCIDNVRQHFDSFT
ncbi:Tubulin-folding cofactor C [Pseudozyma hubeiensis]|nr:Tubulin-folding cofactor C [Pseudozyma hubeiensis]